MASPDEDFNEILPGCLYLGSVRALVLPTNATRLCQLGVTQVVRLVETPPAPPTFMTTGPVVATAPYQEVEMEVEVGAVEGAFRVQLLHVPIPDSTHYSIAKHFRSVAAFTRRGPTLVHCELGASRSATIVIATLILEHSMALREAFEHVLERRPCIEPNRGFSQQLIALENELRPSLVPAMTPDDFLADSYAIVPSPRALGRAGGALYLGPARVAETSQLRRLTARHNVRRVVRVVEQPFDYDKVEVLHVPVPDTPACDIAKHFREVSRFIVEAAESGDAVYIHCSAGISRSVSCVIAHLMLAEGLTLKEAFERVKAVRPMAQPNIGFFRQLVALEGELNGPHNVPTMDADEYAVQVISEVLGHSLPLGEVRDEFLRCDRDIDRAFDALVARMK